MSRTVDLIVIHCSATPDGVSLFEGHAGAPDFCTPIEVIDRWHVRREFRRALHWRKLLNERLAAVGYHFAVYTNGAIATGRHTDEIGAHVYGFNRSSIGICVIGTDRFTAEAWASLKQLVELLKLKYPTARVLGHRDLSPDVDGDGLVERWEWLKTCPGFDVAAWLARGMVPLAENVYTAPEAQQAAA